MAVTGGQIHTDSNCRFGGRTTGDIGRVYSEEGAALTFHGPNGEETFQLEDLVYIIDHYRIVATNQTYINDSGGAGRIRQLADGSYLTEINVRQLAAYESMYHGTEFLILHEASHMLQQSLTYTRSGYLDWIGHGGTDETYRGTTGYNGSSALYRSESYSNNIAYAVETTLRIPTQPIPAGGYNYTGTYTGR